MSQAAHGAQEAAEGASGGFPPFDASLFPHQIFWLVLSFAALYIIVAFAIIPKIQGILGKRKRTIDEDLKKAASATQKAETAKEQAFAAQANAKQEAHAKLDAMRKELDDESAKAQGIAMAEAEEKIKAAEAAIDAQKNDALSAVSKDIGELANDIFEQITGKKANASLIEKAMRG